MILKATNAILKTTISHFEDNNKQLRDRNRRKLKTVKGLKDNSTLFFLDFPVMTVLDEVSPE